ncbi:serine hydrolase domain-containing protein [Leadbettera azotonutricia]|uniref:Beta-lactamase n=1 Tax=Leadbettera azotonutricia (strain ATCC BAA-888 / DSM 13862 / ZAS-9) TaxID=545695 RepID=F5Y8Q5_LEAAZ|nr:serine hydrolase [Leadbettera azotonutricia]AEF83104.1 beta-lactamase [Leadbettera azotonutricia ZAS-9]
MKQAKAFSNIVFLLFVSCMSSSCLMEKPLKITFGTYAPPALGDGWEISDPVAENINSAQLDNIYRYVHNDGDLWQIRSLLVFRNNKLVAESYMKTMDDRINPGAIWSATKQFTAVLAGIAVDKGLIDINAPISMYLSQTPSSKSEITIENLLMMKSGINFDNDGFKGETSQLLREEPSNSVNFILNLSMRNSPGTSFYYNDGDPHIVSAVIQSATDKTVCGWAKEVLFDKIGMERIQWFTYKDGVTLGAFGILTTPREMAKLGQLVLNNGVWNGEQIVSAGWLSEMTSAKVPSNETGEQNIAFGYYWWRDTARDISIMRGHGGQYVFINKDKKLMVVITAEPNTQDDFQLSLHQGLALYDEINNAAN